MAEDWGWGAWLLLGVLAFNLACVPAWLLVANLKRTHETGVARLRAWLALIEGEREREGEGEGEGEGGGEAAAELDASLSAIREQLAAAEGRGAIWGRRPMTSALIGSMQVEARWPEIGERVAERMRRR